MVVPQQRIKLRSGPDGLLFFDRQSGINILVDEIKVPLEKWSKAPRQISVALTNICDLSCSHCYAPKDTSEIDFEKLLTWLKILDSNHCLGIGFGGGEPTLYPRFLELCKSIQNETNLAITMTTHGHTLYGSFLEKLSKKMHFIRISMDGVDSTYEAIRKRPFSQLLQRMASLKGLIPFGINYMVNTATIKDLDRAIEIAESLEAREFLLLPEEPVGKGKAIDSQTKYILQEWINNYSGKVRLSISERHSENLLTCIPLVLEKGLNAYAHIDAKGILKRTSFDLHGIKIQDADIMGALDILKRRPEETMT